MFLALFYLTIRILYSIQRADWFVINYSSIKKEEDPFDVCTYHRFDSLHRLLSKGALRGIRLHVHSHMRSRHVLKRLSGHPFFPRHALLRRGRFHNWGLIVTLPVGVRTTKEVPRIKVKRARNGEKREREKKILDKSNADGEKVCTIM